MFSDANSEVASQPRTNIDQLHKMIPQRVSDVLLEHLTVSAYTNVYDYK